MAQDKHITLNGFQHNLYKPSTYKEVEMLQRSKDFYQWIDARRSVRDISSKPIAKELIENIIKSACTAPSGAHKQPWTFCVVSNKALKSRIRIAAELEEKESYDSRMSDRWKADLAPLGTDMNKPFLEDAPYLIIVFKKVYELDKEGKKHNNYYVNESVGIACGMLISAIHNAGLVTLTHTPSPMNFLSEVLNRPAYERPFLVLPVGFAKEPAYVPNINRKPLSETAVFYE